MRTILITCLIGFANAGILPSNSYLGPPIPPSLPGPGSFQSPDGYDYNKPEEPIVTKNIYVHTAPDDGDDNDQPRVIRLGQPQKNYRVVFIKTNGDHQKGPKIAVLPPQNEEKTVIYVLNKKTDANDIQIEAQPDHKEPSKPEVYFIKYKTPEEALNAQQQIQSHYDSIGGTTNVNDEVIGPIQSVIGSLNKRGPAYLPPQ